jgi:sortase A
VSAGDTVRATVRGLGEVLITLGVVILLFVAYEVYGTNLKTAQEQSSLKRELVEEWSTPQVREIALGDAIAVLRIPALGADYGYAVVEGVSRRDLQRGPGHYPGTAMPGEIGNVVISGHRTTYGAPFSRVGELREGDAVVVETADEWFTYEVTASEIVSPNAVEVTLPVPRQPDVEPTQRLLTLTTCHPRYSARQRLIVFAEMVETRPKTDGAPPVLTGA